MSAWRVGIRMIAMEIRRNYANVNDRNVNLKSVNQIRVCIAENDWTYLNVE